MNRTTDQGAHKRKTVLIELVIIFVATILVFVVAAIFDVHEAFHDWYAPFEGSLLHLDEVFTVAGVLIIGFGIFAARRLRESKHELEERKQIETALKESEEKYKSIYDRSLLYLIAWDMEGKILDANEALLNGMGYRREELVSHNLVSFMSEDQLPVVFKTIEEVMQRGSQKNPVEFKLRKANGDYVWAECEASLVYHDGKPYAILGIGRDITERKQAQTSLNAAKEEAALRAKDLEQHNREIGLLNRMGELLQGCIAFEEAHAVISQFAKQLFPSDSGGIFLYNSSRDRLEPATVWGPVAPKEKEFSPDDCWGLRLGRTHAAESMHDGLRCPHVEKMEGTYMCMPMIAQGETLGILHLMIDLREPALIDDKLIETRRQLAQSAAEHISLSLANLKLRDTLRNLSIRDPLTSLFNRRYIEELLERELYRAKRKGTPIGIIMLDIDHFKRFNDKFGHEAGDALLSELGRFLQQSIRGSDIACRYGGEEFMILLPEASLEDCRERAEHLRQAVKHLQISHEGRYLGKINLSLGVAVFPNHGESAEAVIRTADSALYKAKKSGRDCVCVAEKPQ